MRVFGPSKWRRACYVVFVIISAYTLWAFVTAIVPCNPIPKYWYPAKDGWCFPKAILWFLNAGLNIFTDFLIVILPIPAILALQLPRKQKIGVSLVFTLGFLYVPFLSLYLFGRASVEFPCTRSTGQVSSPLCTRSTGQASSLSCIV